MYVVTREGRKLRVDDSPIQEEDYIPFHATVGLYTDDTVLNEVYILQLYKSNRGMGSRNYELEFIKELKYEHKPTKEEILWAMSAYGLSRYDIATVTNAYELDMEMD